ncbi:TIGR02147 family protein [Fibrobacter sp. UWR2]|uniref:TIGR02147 family protein n=1 Tax=Fibrobacter sp. UWR2 TaxID=1964352 RepID=UPI000B51F1A4|nr:TIGR02147 family protein [Fibrobacter sp. UWR2]MBQ2559014.1 TIGR02147 family protein [Fibrobacter sp.]MBQ5464957.1 TIGR02147 family protein [Fibrobacter sp.]OWV00643.1 TIGR02147 family protein [Fibrobacter sp. UWR2]
MKGILEYTSYRRYIADYYAEKKAKSAFTWQDFTKAAGFTSTVYLKYVSDGYFNLSDAATKRVAAAMNLTEFEQEYFYEMVRFDRAKTDAEKKAIFKKMLSIAESHKAKILEGDSFRYFDSWKNPVIRELAPAMPGAKPLALAHACRPKITAAEVSETLNFLVKANLLQKDKDGKYAQTEIGVSTGPMDATPVAVREMHRQMGEFALGAIEGVPQNERHFSGLTLGVTHDAYDEIVQEIAEFRKRIIAIATRTNDTDEVYRLNVQFFPMTKKCVKKD